MYPQFKKNILSKSLIVPRSRVVVGVSGGLDSMVLLDLLSRAAKNLNLRISIAHVNYRLRGRDADADEALVKSAAISCGADYHILRKRPARGKNVQDSARRIRYEFFADIAKRTGARIITVAHHMDDQAETILLHLIRGAGIKGLSGMKEISELNNFKIVRPLLQFSREEIMAYAKGRGIKYREDATNAGTKYARGAIRHNLIPLLRQFNPRIEKSLADMAARLAQDDEALSIVSEEAFDQALAEMNRRSVTLKRDEYVHLPAALRKRVLRIAFENAAGTSKDLNADQIKRMDEISRGHKAGSYRLPKACKFTRAGNCLTIRRMGTRMDRPPSPS